MSVTIQIDGNRDYCDRAGLTKIEQVECYCGDCDQGFEPHCDSCGGTGKMLSATYPYELNIANSNWAALVAELGIANPGRCYEGECWGHRLKVAVKHVEPDALTKTGQFDVLDALFEAGRSRQQVERYLQALEMIAQEAMRREERVIWH